MRKLIVIALTLLVLYGISQQPRKWADAGKGAGNKISQVADGFGTFFTDLFT